jgi:polysaccharide biosynthesis/export protein
MKMTSTLLRWLTLCAVLFGLTGIAMAAQSQPAKRTEKKHVPYRITRGDMLSVEVLAGPEREFAAAGKRVEATGTINLLYIQEIRLVGLTIAEAQQAIANAYREGRFIRNPIVNVTVETYAQRHVIVNGKVNITGRQPIEPDSETTILDVISTAGGLGETARGKEVKVTRTKPDGTLETYILDVESALRGRARPDSGDAAFVVQPDDVIYVPEKII